MIFPEVIGHEGARTVLERVLASGRVPHAILFHGPEGVGKGVIARAFAASLLCETPVTGASCGACGACRKVAHGNHPDLFVITRLARKMKERDGGDDEPEEGGSSPEEGASGSGDLRPFILVSQIRELTEHASYAPREGPRRVFVIDPADRMNAVSQNALLKTLEEPPGQAVLLLVASRPHVLLPTVRSRCFQVGLGALAPDVLARELVRRGMDPDEARARAALSDGRPGIAVALDVPERAARRGRVLVALLALATTPAAAAKLPGWAAEVVGEDEEHFLLGLDLAAGLLRDAARTEATGAGATDRGTGPSGDVAALGRALGAPRAAELVALADRLRHDLRLNLNKALVAETLLAAVAGASVVTDVAALLAPPGNST